MPDPDETTTGHDARNRSGHDERGAVAVAVAVLAATLFVLLAFVVDLGLAYDGSRQAQSAADSAALAAATTLSIDVFGDSPRSLSSAQAHALEVAKSYAESNAGIADDDWPNCSDPKHLADTPDAPNTCISFDNTRARVVLPRHNSPAVLGGLVGTGPIEITATGVAQWAESSVGSCWLCIQGLSSAVGLDAQDGTVTLEGGNIRIGTSKAATASLTTGYVRTDSISRIGYTGATPAGPLSHYLPGVVQVGNIKPATGWPLFTFGTPVVAPAGKCSAGTYSDITQCTGFSSGFYVITGPNVFTGNQSLSTDANVFFYLTCSANGRATPCRYASNKSGGTLTWSRNADFSVSGWSFFGWAFAIAVDPGNTAQQLMVSTDHGTTGRFSVTGSVFAPNSTLAISATNTSEGGLPEAPSTSLFKVKGQVTVDRLTLSGAGAQLYQWGPAPSNSASTPVPVHLVQ